MTQTIDEVRTHREGSIFEIVLNRPKAKNALSVAMYDALSAALAEAQGDDSVLVVFLRGEGGNFSSGNDLKDFLANPPKGPESSVFRFIRAIAEFPKPIVACVEGVAVGLGTTMLLHCDLVYAADDARFSLPFVNLGLVPEAASTFLLSRTLGTRRAAELLYFGEAFGADVAKEAGLVNATRPKAEVEAYARAQATRLASQSPTAIRKTKDLLRSHHQAPLLEHMDVEANVFASLLGTPEVNEALNAFFEKRKPDFAKLR
jgi:enoyl-CoA hydratase/carnithine racemase